jgi:electron transport complex protein RnfG
MKDAAKLGSFLMIVCVLASLGLAVTNKATAPIIRQQKEKARQDAMSAVVPAAATFEEKTNDSGKGPDTYAIGKDKDGNPVGMVFQVEPRGYGGPLKIMVGMDNDHKLTGIQIMEMQETPGLGAKAKDPEFMGQFSGKSADQLFLSNKDEQQGAIDGITAATITSKAVTKGVREGTEAMQNVLP